MGRTRAIILLIAALSFFSAAARGQVATGFSPFGSYSGSSFGTVNNANLNVFFNIPIVNKAGRGIPLYYNLAYNSSIWTPEMVNGSKVWVHTAGWGWEGITSAYAGESDYQWQQGSCDVLFGGTGIYQTEYYDIFANWTYTDTSGTVHSFWDLTTSDASWMAPDCGGPNDLDSYSPPPPDQASATASDGSNYKLDATEGSSAVVHSPQGTVYTPPINSPSGNASVTDTNGNHVSVSVSSGTTTFTDTLGTATLAVSGNGSQTSPILFKYLNTAGTQETIKVEYAAENVQTNFNCSGIADFGPTLENLPIDVTLPDGEKYVFGYESTPGHAGNTTGRLWYVELPSGGIIWYTYPGANDGVNCTDGSTMTLDLTTPDSSTAWQYSRNNVSGTEWQTILTDPDTNNTTYYFQSATPSGSTVPNFYETERDLPGGSETIHTCYNGASYPCNTSGISLPIARRTTWTTLGGQTAETDTDYDTYGLPTEVDEYDWGGTTPARKTITAYDYNTSCGIPTGSYIHDRPCSVTIMDGGTGVGSRTYQYDTNGNLTSVTSGLTGNQLTQSFTYNTNGTLQYSKDAGGNQTTYSYGGNSCSAFPDTITPPISADKTTIVWNCNTGLPTSVKDANNQTTKFSYDDMNRLTGTSYPDGGSVTTDYSGLVVNGGNPAANISTTTQITGSTSRPDKTYFDGLGRVFKQIVADVETDTTYDKLGRLATTTISGSGAKDTYAYDSLGRILSITHADNNAVATDWTSDPQCPTTTDESGKTKEVCTDALGRVTKVIEDPGSSPHLNYITTYIYDALNDLTTVTAGSQTRTYQYDSLGRLTSATTPESGTTTYSYYTSGVNTGDLYQRKDAHDTTTTYSYDLLHRLKQKSYSDGTPTANYDYDQGSVTIGNWSSGTLANPLGRLTEATTTSSGSVQTALVYGYDPMGRIKDLWQCTPYNCGSSMWAMAYNYDLAGDVTSYTHPAGFTITNTINDYQQITKITSSLNDSNHPGTLATMAYNSWGALATLTNGCAGSGCIQTQETYDYNNRLQPFRIQLGTSSNSSADSCLVYNYYQGEPQPASCTSTPAQPSSGDDGSVAGYFYQDNANSGLSHTASFTYDGANQLATAVATGNSTYNLTYSFTQDGSNGEYGNMSCVVNQNTQGLCPQYTYDASTNRISNSGYTYDPAGDLTYDGTYSYQYDAEGRLMKVLQGSIVLSTNTYNALGEQVRRDRPAASLDFAFGASGQMMGIFHGGAYWDANNFWLGGRLLGFYDPPDNMTFFLHRSQIGSLGPMRLTDATGGGRGNEIFYPYGQQWKYANAYSSTWLQFYGGFSRYEYDLGLYTTPNRFYPPTLGRWMTPDKLGGDVTNPQSLNRYAYVLNNPATLTDPLGLDPYSGGPGGTCSDPAYADSHPECGWSPCWGLTPEAMSQSNCDGFPAGIGGGGGGGGGSVLPPVPPAGQPPLAGGENFAGLPPCIDDYNSLIQPIVDGLNATLHPTTEISKGEVQYSHTEGGAPQFTVAKGVTIKLSQPLKGHAAWYDFYHHSSMQVIFRDPKVIVPGAGNVYHVLYDPKVKTSAGATQIQINNVHFDMYSARSPGHIIDLVYAPVVSAIEHCGKGGIKFQ